MLKEIAMGLAGSVVAGSFLGNCLSLLVLWRMSKQTKPALYQVALILTDLLLMISFPPEAYRAFFVEGKKCGISSYFVLWLLARPCNVIRNALLSAGIVICILACVDRLTAIEKPVMYKARNHVRYVLASVLIAYCLGFATFWQNGLNFLIVPCNGTCTCGNSTPPLDEGLWTLVPDRPYLDGPVDLVMSWTFALFRALSFCSLVYYSIRLARKYREFSALNSQSNSSQRYVSPRSLTQLLGLQAFIVLMGTGPYTASVLVVEFFDPETNKRILEAVKLNEIAGVAYLLQVSLNFLIYFLMSSSFRREAIVTVKFWRKSSGPNRNRISSAGRKSNTANRKEVAE